MDKRFTQIAIFLKVHTYWGKFKLSQQNICINVVNIDWGGGVSWSMVVFLDCPLGVVTASVHVLLKESVSDV